MWLVEEQNAHMQRFSRRKKKIIVGKMWAKNKREQKKFVRSNEYIMYKYTWILIKKN